MLENYHIDDFGVIHQMIVSIITYNASYSLNRYDTIKDKVQSMSCLRIGYLLSNINEVPESILDVGYGNGSFISTCSNIVSKCYCNDVSDYPVPQGISYIDDITSQYFDVITFFDSLEHFEDISVIGRLKCKYVMISIPWCHNYSDEWFDNWKHRRPNEHLHHFNEKSLVSFFNKHGYELVVYSNIEDAIRISDESNNILTAIFKKK